MAYYRECPDCGSNLDPGERCECVRERALFAYKMSQALETDDDGQIKFNFEEGVKKAI